MARFTREQRQAIVREFATRHNGVYNANLFLEEVRRSGASHPAFEWFEWDVDKAAAAYQIEQARDFARDLRVHFSVEEICRNKAITIRETVMPLVISPMSGRHDGGGYILTDPTNPEHMSEHRRQAAEALRQWLRRYEAAAMSAGVSVSAIAKTADLIDRAVAPVKAVAA